MNWQEEACTLRRAGKNPLDIARALKQPYDAVRAAVKGVYPARKELPNAGRLWSEYGIRAYETTKLVVLPKTGGMRLVKIRLPMVSILGERAEP